jgi:hypothetical protein
MAIRNPNALKALLPRGRRLIGLDVGEKTTAAAISDPDLIMASPIDTIRRGEFAEDPGSSPTSLYAGSRGQTRNTDRSAAFLLLQSPRRRPHRYVLQIFAVDMTVDVVDFAGRRELLDAMANHVIEKVCMIGICERA